MPSLNNSKWIVNVLYPHAPNESCCPSTALLLTLKTSELLQLHWWHPSCKSCNPSVVVVAYWFAPSAELVLSYPSLVPESLLRIDVIPRRIMVPLANCLLHVSFHYTEKPAAVLNPIPPIPSIYPTPYTLYMNHAISLLDSCYRIPHQYRKVSIQSAALLLPSDDNVRCTSNVLKRLQLKSEETRKPSPPLSPIDFTMR